MRYLKELHRGGVDLNGPFVTAGTRAGRALIRLTLRKDPDAAAPQGFVFVYLRAGRNSRFALVTEGEAEKMWGLVPRSRVDCSSSIKCGCDGPVGLLAEEQEKCYAAARRFRFTADERRNADTMILAASRKEEVERRRIVEATRREERRILRLWSVRHAFVGSRSSSRAKRKTILSLGVPI